MPRYYNSVVRSHQAAQTAGCPLLRAEGRDPSPVYTLHLNGVCTNCIKEAKAPQRAYLGMVSIPVYRSLFKAHLYSEAG
jgi:hypothetical protein